MDTKFGETESWISYYNRLLEEREDPRVKGWFLMDNPLYTVGIVIVYLFWIYVYLPKFMENRKPYDLKKIIRIYNIFQIVSCSILTYKMFSGWIFDNYNWTCQPVDYSNNEDAIMLVHATYWHYLLRMAEFFETTCFILRKKFNQVTNLHVYHHASTVFLAYFMARSYGGGMFMIQTGLNMVIHTVMYTYYYLSSLGPRWQKVLAPWKPFITIAQMIQFMIMLTLCVFIVSPNCQVSNTFFYFYIPNVAFMLWMFFRFYVHSYQQKKKNLKRK